MQNHPLTAARERLGLTRRQLADAVNKILYPDPGQAAHSAFTANYLGKLENGKIRYPAEDYRTALRIALNANTDDELGFRNPRTVVRQDAAEISAVSGNRRVVPVARSVGSTEGLVEQPSVILTRIRENNDASVNHALLDTLDLYVSDVVGRYEEEGPLTLAADVVRQRRWVQSLIPLRMQPRYSARLLAIAGQLSGLLSYMSVNLGRFSSARAYGIEAFQLADYAEDRELKAWVRGTQSFTEFYDGQYRKALAYAVDGRRFAGRGAQTVRLAVNGEARAHAKLGQTQEAEQAIGTAYEVLSDLSPEPGMSSCVSFGLYSEARVASNAATAYLALGHTEQVLHLAGRAVTIVDSSPSVWSQALVRLDLATALVDGDRPDVGQAADVARQAMRACQDNQIESIRQRTRDLATAIKVNFDDPCAESFVDEAHAWLDEGRGTR
ncbi:hypothetical protein EDC02_6042 [Micromonospora sp. Llam0]|uniref:hypothetical protein n=1 Tax=Micromonospora sp. Llam0 TaxID=2485143 RepID=UPI000FBC86CD|nr:hypothetical protein [Micromonospora sp. Llam0]ROO51174.1 hypothetical protein EDC02_6042 [Micromonospora sp. Llam0]